MAQRPRLSQLKRTDVNYPTFEEQFNELERETVHARKPVNTFGELPMQDNGEGDEVLVLSENVKYRWDSSLQNWRSIMGKGYDLPSGTIKRYKKSFTATEGQTIFTLDFRYELGTGTLDAFINGILQDVNIDYYEIDERTVEFITPLTAGMEVTFTMPYVVGDAFEANELKKRLAAIEHNHYQLMMNQYYTGKPITARSLAYDGFLNTELVDYTATSNSIEYDTIERSMKLKTSVISELYETFDTTTNIDPVSTTYMSNSEITLPMLTSFIKGFEDDFSTDSLMDVSLTNAYHDTVNQLITTTDTQAGGEHYYKGDFMTTTGNADRVGFRDYGYTTVRCDYHGTDYIYFNRRPELYGLLAMGNIISNINGHHMGYNSVWDYSSYTWHYSAYAGYYDHRGSTNGTYSHYGYDADWHSIFPTNDGWNYRSMGTYIRATNQIVFLHQYHEGSGKYYQRLTNAIGQRRDIGGWTWWTRPIGLPNTMFGSDVTTYTESTDHIDQIGATYNELILRSGDKVFFIDPGTNTVTKTFDYSNATRKPSLYVRESRQITADRRYLYFPARLHRDAEWGYYLEVFSLADGSFVNEILVTKSNGGDPYTTAMGFDHDNNRMVLGLRGYYWYAPHLKNYHNYYTHSSYAGFFSFAPPEMEFRVLHSKKFQTNLPVITYNLEVDQTLNDGIIDYYIRIGSDTWQKISPATNYTWNNPNGASLVDVQLRAMLRTTLNATTAPTLTRWALNIKPFNGSASYQSVEKFVSLTGSTGGKLKRNQDHPNETSINWSVKLNTDAPEITIANDGSFSIPEGMADGYMTVFGRMATNNPLLSPVVRNIELHLHSSGSGILESNVFDQIEDISNATMWVTTGTTPDYYTPYLSRDGGVTWEKATVTDTLRTNDGKIEAKFSLTFATNTVEKQKLKVKFDMQGATEIHQYGVFINTV